MKKVLSVFTILYSFGAFASPCTPVGDTDQGKLFEITLKYLGLRSEIRVWQDKLYEAVEYRTPSREKIEVPRESEEFTTKRVGRYKDQNIFGKARLLANGIGPGENFVETETRTETESYLEWTRRQNRINQFAQESADRHEEAIAEMSARCLAPLWAELAKLEKQLIELDARTTHYLDYSRWRHPFTSRWPSDLVEYISSENSPIHPVAGVDYHWLETAGSTCEPANGNVLPSYQAPASVAECISSEHAWHLNAKHFEQYGGILIP